MWAEDRHYEVQKFTPLRSVSSRQRGTISIDCLLQSDIFVFLHRVNNALAQRLRTRTRKSNFLLNRIGQTNSSCCS